MSYGAAGLGYGASQAFASMGDTLDRVMGRREERDRYEMGLRMQAQQRKEAKDRQSLMDTRYEEGIQRASDAQDAALERQEKWRYEDQMAAVQREVARARQSGFAGAALEREAILNSMNLIKAHYL